MSKCVLYHVFCMNSGDVSNRKKKASRSIRILACKFGVLKFKCGLFLIILYSSPFFFFLYLFLFYLFYNIPHGQHTIKKTKENSQKRLGISDKQ